MGEKAFVLLLFMAFLFRVMGRIGWHQSKSLTLEILTKTEQKHYVSQFSFDVHNEIDRELKLGETM